MSGSCIRGEISFHCAFHTKVIIFHETLFCPSILNLLPKKIPGDAIKVSGKMNLILVKYTQAVM